MRTSWRMYGCISADIGYLAGKREADKGIFLLLNTRCRIVLFNIVIALAIEGPTVLPSGFLTPANLVLNVLGVSPNMSKNRLAFKYKIQIWLEGARSVQLTRLDLVACNYVIEHEEIY